MAGVVLEDINGLHVLLFVLLAFAVTSYVLVADRRQQSDDDARSMDEVYDWERDGL